MATRVYVGDISAEATKEDLESIFIRMGRLRDVWVAHNPPGFAFVDFVDPDDAARACRKLNGNIICGARAVVQIAKKQHQENGLGAGPSFQNRSQRPFQFNRRDRSSMSPPPQGFYNQQRGPSGPRRSPVRQQPSSPGRRPRRSDYSSPPRSRSPVRSRRMSPSPPPSQRYPPVHQSQQHPVLPAGYDYDKLYEIYARAARDEFERFRQDYEARLKRKSRSRSPRSPPPPRKHQESSDRRPQGDGVYRRDSPAKRSRRSPSPRSLHESAQRGINRRHQPAMSPPSPEHDLRYAPRRGMSPDGRHRSRSSSPRSSSLHRGSQRVHSGRPRSPATAGRPRSPPPIPRRPASPPPGVSRRPPSPRSPRSPCDSKPLRGGRGSPSGSRPLPPPRRSRSSSRRSRSASLPKAYRSTVDGGSRPGRV